MTQPRRLGWAFLGLLAALSCFAAPGAARAGTLDKALLGPEIADILAEARRLKYEDLGVLPFKVKKGTRPASYAGAPLCQDLPRRLENALVVALDVPAKGKPVGIIRDAASAAAKAGVGSYTKSEAEFKSLFAQPYRLAWGEPKTRIRADSFLHGTVYSTGDRKTTTVEVQLFDARCWKDGRIVPRKTWKIPVRTDRPLLADLGYGFALSRSAFDDGGSTKKLDDAAVEQATVEEEKGKPAAAVSPAAAGHTPADIGGLAFELRYNHKKQPLAPLAGGKGAGQPEFEAPPAPPGGKISMHLTRRDGDPVKKGVVLLVNGVSTLKKQTGDPLTMLRWTLDTDARGVTQDWDGFYLGDKAEQVLPFQVLTPEESLARAAEFGSHAGWIHLYVFVSRAGGKAGPPPAKPAPTPEEKEEYDAPKLFYSMRSLPTARYKTAQGLREDLMRRYHLRPRQSPKPKPGEKPSPFADRGLIVAGVEAVAAPPSESSSFPYPELVASLAIRYFAPGGKKIEKGADD